jgi:hypothetical protein
MGRFHHSKKGHSEGRKKKKNKFAAGKTGIRSWTKILSILKSIRISGILFAVSWTKNLPKKI